MTSSVSLRWNWRDLNRLPRIGRLPRPGTLSMPLLVLVVAILAVPLSKTNPRQGRYMKMIPAILLYFIYLASLTFAKSAVEDGRLSVAIGIWWVHGVFLLFAVYLYGHGRWTQKIKSLRQSEPGVNHA